MVASRNGGLVHQQFIPADSITASYDNEAKLLILKASGNHVDLTRDIKFRRLPFAGGLLFELIGLVGPVVRGESPYEIMDSFNIDLPSIVFPSNTVVVNTENKQHWVVPIQYNKTTAQAATNGKAEVELPEVQQVSGDQKIVVLADEPFTIQQIFVYVGQTQPSFIYRIPYVVESVVLDDKSVPTQTTASFSVNNNGQGSSGTYGTASTGHKNGNQKVGLPLSWDGFINVGLNLIKKQYPNANLLEVDATPLTRKPVQNEWGLVNNRIVCGLSGNKTAIIQSTGWGEFGKVQTIDSPFLGDQVISWPVALHIHDAFAILRKAGYKQAVYAVTLRQPLYPGDDQPFYIFNTGNEFIAVGTKDKKIHNFGVSEYNVQKA
ncbi:hypothetical protein FGADI_6890 [Fusarium gaditjirri]|uniref:Uncharacterized protein n=1 Tax=Fusarium gaditjirri TaxID=282569 RepID=A0A8H4T6P4_9HYPO|nr:hypothetical protein FGADI_6890 [Fusarium gaditjirri]